MRILITGGPKTGKTTLSRELFGLHLCTDNELMGGDVSDFLELPKRDRWSAASQQVAEWLSVLNSPWVIEGIAVPRALRKWREQYPDEPPPCDQLIVLVREHAVLTERQQRMRAGVHTVLDELRPWIYPVLRIQQ